MGTLEHSRRLLDQLKQCLAAQIKVDIARTIRHHPHLEGDGSVRAYDALASDDSIETLIRELAREECEAAIRRGDIPAAAMIHLAGYTKLSSSLN